MDDIVHDFPVNHRKRKADNDGSEDSSAADSVVSPEVIRIDTTSLPPPAPSNAPRQPWLASDSDNVIWTSPTSPQVSSPLSQVMFNVYPSKRPRVEKTEPALRKDIRRTSRRSSGKVSPSRPPPTVRQGNDIEDTGIVSTSDPGPSSGSLLHLRDGPSANKPADQLPSPDVPFIIDSNSPHIPSLQPLINRQTLRELDLDAILRNPQLRHDLLFDPGLQFRPTCSRRKRDMSEKYWAAVVQELENGCTCVSFDLAGKPHSVVCACTQVSAPSTNPVVAFSPLLSVLTLRMPSRIRNLLSEFLEVLLLVIQPLSSISGMYVNPSTFKSQMQEHSAQAAYIRSVFDPTLIEQEMKHELFDPSGLFRSIGITLKGHCAPMRDRAVELMVQAAQDCTPGGSGTRADAVKAVRMCLEILELMKLDIANHQLQTLRPFLIRTSGQFELKTFKNRSDCSLRITREWLRTTHSTMLTRTRPISHPLYPPGHLRYSALGRKQQAYLATIKGLVDLVFVPPPVDSSPPSSPISPTQFTFPTISPLPGYPETSYLDSARLLLLNTDAADATALYMFLLLYRQLAFSDTGETYAPKMADEELSRMKTEIRDIGSTRLGYCFSHRYSSDNPDCSHAARKEAERWRTTKGDIILQIAMRAGSRGRTDPIGASASYLHEPPGEQILGLAQRWADSNIQAGSALSTMLRDRLRDVVFNAVVTLAYPGRDSTTGKLTSIDFFSFDKSEPSIEFPLGTATGMEPLSAEIRSLAEKISRLALIHLNAYLPLYEHDDFLGI